MNAMFPTLPTAMRPTLCLIVAFALASPVRAGLGLDDLRSFTEAFDYIQRHYVEDLDEQDLLHAAIRGMFAELDSNSAWLSADDMDAMEATSSGRYAGLGVRIQVHEQWLEVLAAMPGTPAARAGLRVGDRIVAVDGRTLADGSADQAAARLRGEPGSAIALTVERDDVPLLELNVTRELIHVASVTSELLDADLGYLRIRSFQYNTAGETADALRDLARRQPALAGLVLDLRGNPGGVLNAAVAVADQFLNDGLIVTTESRGHTERRRYAANSGDMADGVPVVVLVDRASASGAEIVAGALQANRRAVIMGETTYGKGSIQSVWPLANGTGMRLTTSRYFTPDGRAIQAKGIEPDVRHTPPEEVGTDAPTDHDHDGHDPIVSDAVRLLNSARVLSRAGRWSQDG